MALLRHAHRPLLRRRHGGLPGPQLGQVAGRIDEILPVAEIIRRTVAEFGDVLTDLADRYLAGADTPWTVALRRWPGS